ncbi:MAG: hypothetical protein N2045_13850 [Fimbriimonadales bacterium]|nr:hypothetical protein [Fimbriimonadales bacterium]
MPYTLAEYKAAQENSIDTLVIDEFRRSSWLLDNILFDDGANVTGAATWQYAYDRVTTLTTAATRAVNAEYVPQEPKTTKVTVECKILGGSFEMDRTQVATPRFGSLLEFMLRQKIQATQALFSDLFINGDDAGDPTQFDGVDVAVTGSSTDKNAASLALDTSANIDSNYKAFMDIVFDWLSTLDGRPSALLMNRSMRSKMRSIAFRAGYLTQTEDAFGRNVEGFDGIPMVDLGDKPGTSNPIIPTATGLTKIYAVRLGLDGVHGVSPNGAVFLRTYLPDLALPGAVKKGEVEMVATIALKATRAAGVLRNIKIA